MHRALHPSRAPRTRGRRYHSRLHQYRPRTWSTCRDRAHSRHCKELRAALDRAIASAEFEEAEVRGKAAMPFFRAA